MQDIKAILKEHAPDLSDEAKAAVEKAVLENYRTVNETNAKAERVKQLEAENAELTEKVESIEADSKELDELKETVAQFKEKEEQRKAEAEEAEKRETFKAAFDNALGERKFSNDLMRDTVFDKAYKLCGEDSAVGVSDAIESVTKDVDGVWSNPQQDAKKMPGTNGIERKTPEPSESKKTFAKTLFGGIKA